MKRVNYLLQLALAIVCAFGYAQELDVQYTSEKITGTSESYVFTSEKSSTTETAHSTATSCYVASDQAGSTAGSLSVSMTGTANYTIPIMVPPGIKDVAPQLSLSYSSQSSNGLAGWGWDISGLSTISRVAATEYYDGFHDGIDFNNDRFALDGQRLILKSGSYGSNGSVYETENYSNIKVRAYGTSPYGGPSYFIVFYPNGARAWYGQYSGSGELEWAINKWQDNRGNSINYVYSKNGGLLNIHSISYGKYGHTNRIDFKYKTRKRPEQVYVGGRNYTKTKLLDEIKVYAKTTPYRRYKLTYNKTSLDYERLTGVQEFNTENKAFNPIRFNYNDTSSTLKKQANSVEITPGIDYKNTKSVAGDFDGDGYMDLILYNKYTKKKLNLFNNLHNSTNNNAWNINTGQFESVFPSTFQETNNRLYKGQAITTVKESINMGSETSNVNFRFYKLNNYKYNKVWHAPTYEGGTVNGIKFRYKIPKKYISGDFDGDGLTDVLAISKPYTYSDCSNRSDCEDPKISDKQHSKTNKSRLDIDECCEDIHVTQARVHFIDLDRFKTSNFSNYSGQLYQPLKQKDVIRVADFNGDGRQDIYHFSSNALSIYTLDENKKLKHLHTRSMSINFEHPILLGDFNGDGKTDLMIPEKDKSYKWKHFMSTGINFSYYNTYTPIYFEKFRTVKDNNEVVRQVYEFHYAAQDYNGDGKADILKHEIKTWFETGELLKETLKTYENIKTSITRPVFTLDNTYSSNSSKISIFGFPSFMDLTQSDGRLEYAYISKNDISVYSLSKDHKTDVSLTSVTNNGLNTKIEYETLGFPDPNQNTIYEEVNNQIYPFINVNRAAGYRLVKRLTEYGARISRYQDFYYKGAVTHIDQGFLGFMQTKRSNWYGDGVGKLWTISNHDLKKKGAVTTQWVSTSPYVGNSFMSRTTTTYQTSLSTKKVFTNIPTNIVQYDNLTNSTKTKTFVYDEYNNPKQEFTYFNGGSNKVNYEYSNNPNLNSYDYHIGRVRKKTEVNKIGSNTFTTYEEFVYGLTKLVEAYKIRTQNAPWNTEHYTYDSSGNIIKKQLNANGLTARTEHFEYDDSRRFLKKSKDIEGLTTQYTYDVFGNPKTTTNPYGQTTSFDYDGWGRLVSEQNYLGKYTYFAYTKLAGGGLSKRTQQQGGKDETVVYNVLGWVTQTAVMGINNERIFTFYHYDVAGRIIKESEPWQFGVGNMQWNSVDYDGYGREIVRRRFNGQTVTTDYSGLTVTVNDGVKTVKTTKDGGGNIIKLQDPGGTIIYTYHGNGVMKTANYGGNIVRTEIDDWGRKDKLIDPSAGTYTYKYNAIGELLEETTPKGKTTYGYDAFGKLKQKNSTGSETNLSLTYTYNKARLLAQISGYDGLGKEHYKYTYAYDNHQRLYKTTETNGSAHFAHQRVYDDYGRVFRDVYYNKFNGNNTSNYVRTTNVFDPGNGELVAIKDTYTHKELWKLEKANARGQAEKITLGNGITKERKYTTYGHLAQITDQGTNSTALNIKFNFDAQRGNLLSRGNLTMNWSETFTYDSLDRLTQVNGPKNRHQSYDNRGRITNNSNVGQYNYAGYTSYRLKNIKLNTTGNNYYKTHTTQDIVYNAFKKPVSVKTKNKGRATFEYGVLQNRSHAYYRLPMNGRGGKGSYQKHYSAISPVEIQVDNLGNTKIMTYIGGDAYSAPIVHLKQTKSGQSNGFHYLHRDYLGSILAITNSSGTVLERRQFGAWGTVDKFIDHKGNKTFTHDSLLNRGYTGHEHFFEIDLIHMNGRMYDANLGRFLSPDNYIQEPFNTQNFNRYGYVLNNPLKYTDASGEFFWIAVLIGAFMGGVTAAIKGGDFGDILLGALIGGVAAGVGAGVANLAAGGCFIGGEAMAAIGFWNGALAGAAGGFAAGFSGAALTTWANGGNLGDGLAAGFKAGVQGALIGAAVGGITGGVRASKQGKGFWSGLDNSRPQVNSVSELTPYGVKKFANSKIEANFEVKYNPIKASGGSNLLKGPTGYGMRNDAGGLGHYNAPRGNRLHGGIDFSSVDGQDIISPIDGKVRNFIGSTSGKPMLEIIPNNPNLGFNKMQMLYVDPPNGMDFSFSFRNISAGDVIGNSVNLQSLGYSSSVGPHVHLQMFNNSVRINPTTYFFLR
ncbi:MAG: FG-GAP-like repeat-containing protein [Bacteroidia bacterium]